MQAKMKALAAAAALVAGLGFGSGANANIVDLFDDPFANGVNFAEDTTVGGAVTNQYGPVGSILGGYRELVSDLTFSNGIGTAVVRSEVSGGGYSFSSSSGDIGIGQIWWDGNTPGVFDPTGLGGENLKFQTGCPTAGCTEFVATVLETDLGFTYSIGVYTDGGNYSILTSTVPVGFSGGAEAVFQFADWLLASGNYIDPESGIPFNIQRVGAGPDFENVGALTFIVNSDGGTTAVDLALDAVEKRGVPEPGTLALLGIGLLGASSLRRRHRKVAAR